MVTALYRKIFVALLALVWMAAAQAALNLADALPVGHQVEKGQLANGLTYYIQKNARPEKRLELRLVVKAGSVLEDEDQRGLAHFTEHMAFNGSTHFKKHELISYLQSIGLKFGADLNAYTSFNETVYILPIPTDKREQVEKAFLVLEDWAHGLRLDDADIDSERAIILEELRLGKGAQDRMNKVILPKIFSGSLYAKRLPIGTEDNLKQFKPDSIRRFYRDWYRPNLMAVVVVGDIDLVDARGLIESHFGKLVNPRDERPRTYPAIGARASSEAVVVTDLEATNNVMRIYYPLTDARARATLGDYRQGLVESLFGSMLGQRIQEITQQATPPFVGGGGGLSKLAPGYRAFVSSAVLGREGSAAASDALLAENQRARQFGFSAQELERAKKNLLRSVEQGYAEREKTDSNRYAAEYIRNFLEQEEIPGITNELAYVRELLPGIELADVNRFAQSVLPQAAAKLVVYSGSAKADSNTPKEEQLLSQVQAAEQRPVLAKVERQLATSFLARAPQAGSIVAERKNAALGLVEWDLSNGVRVVLKPTDFQNDQILLGASRFGGQSLFDVGDKFNAGYASAAVAAMGVGDYAPTDAQKMLSGKLVSLRSSVNALSEDIGGYASNADLETLFVLLHRKFGAVRRDPDLFASFVSRSQDAARNSVARPESVFADAVQTTLYADHPRLWLTARAQDFDNLSLDRIEAIESARFSSAKGFSFVLVGSFTLEQVRPLVATYLASLPVPELVTAYRDLGVRPVSTVVQRQVRSGAEPKARVALQFSGAAAYSEEEQLRLSAMVEVLNIRIIDVLREKLTLIYGGGMGGGLGRTPYEHYQLGLNLPCAPENVDKVVAAAWAEIEKLQTSGPDAADLSKVKQNWTIARRKALRENSFWLGQLQLAMLFGTDPAKVLEFDQQVGAISAEQIRVAARRYLRRDQHVQVMLLPQE